MSSPLLPADDGAGPEPSPAAIAATQDPVALRISLVKDERVPDNMVCMGTFIADRLVARCVMPPEAWEELDSNGVFDDPVPVVLVAREAPPGLQCQLYAMIVLPPEVTESAEDDAEPWAASVPSSSYEAAVAEDSDEDDDPHVAPVPLGNIVRYKHDRVHPDNLPLEAADVLRKIIEGKTTEMVDRALADLLGL